MKKVFADKRINVAIIMAISVVNLWVSFMMAAQLYAESRLIPHEVLIVSCFLLLEILVPLSPAGDVPSCLRESHGQARHVGNRKPIGET